MLKRSDEGYFLDRRVISEISTSGGGNLTAETPPYSSDPSTARQLVRRMQDEGEYVDIEHVSDRWTCTLSHPDRGVRVSFGETEALAICEAFLERGLERARFR